MISRITFKNYKINNNNNNFQQLINSSITPTKDFIEFHSFLNNNNNNIINSNNNKRFNNRYYSNTTNTTNTTSTTESIIKLLKKIIKNQFGDNKQQNEKKQVEPRDDELIEKTKSIAYKILHSNDLKSWEGYEITEKNSILLEFVEIFNNPTFETHRIYGFIIEYLLKNGEEQEALYFFSKLKLKTSTNEHYYYKSFNLFITHYVKSGRNMEALNFFKENILLFKGYVESDYFLIFLQNWFDIIKLQMQQQFKKLANQQHQQYQQQQHQQQHQLEKYLSLLVNEILKIIKDNSLINKRVYENIIGSLVYTRQFNEALKYFEDYKEYINQQIELQKQQQQQNNTSITSIINNNNNNINNNNSNNNNIINNNSNNNIYNSNNLNYYLFQLYIVSDNLKGCKNHFKNVINNGGVIKPIVLYHLLNYSRKKDNEFSKELEDYYFNRCLSNEKSAALVLFLSKYFQEEVVYGRLLNRLKGLIKNGSIQEQKLALSIFDFTILLFLKGSYYQEALRLYSIRLLDFGLAPSPNVFTYFMAYHIERFDFYAYDYWAQLSKSFNTQFTKDGFLSSLNTFKEYGLVENYNLCNFFLKLKIPKEEDPEYLKRFIPIKRDINNYETNSNNNNNNNSMCNNNIELEEFKLNEQEEEEEEYNSYYNDNDNNSLKIQDIQIGTKLIDIINQIKNTGDLKSYIDQLYLPGNKLLQSIAFDPSMYDNLLNPTNSSKVLQFGLELLNKESPTILNLPTTTANLFNLYLSHYHLDMANKYFEKLIINHNIMYIDDIPTNRANYLKISISDKVISTIMDHLKQKKPLQVYMSNILLKNLLINYSKTQIPIYETLFLESLQRISDFNKDTIIIYIDYLIKKKEKQYPNLTDSEMLKQLLQLDFVWEFYDSLKSLSKDIPSSEFYDNKNREIVDIEGNKNNPEPIQIKLPPKRNILQSTNSLRKEDLLQPNQSVLIIEAICQTSSSKYLEALVNHLKSPTTTFDEKVLILKNLSQNSFKKLISTERLLDNSDFIIDIFTIYNNVNKIKSLKKDLIILLKNLNNQSLNEILLKINISRDFIPDNNILLNTPNINNSNNSNNSFI